MKRRRRRVLSIDEQTAFAYVRCALPPEWEEFYLSQELAFPSRSAKNRWFQEQWNCIRRFAKKKGLKVQRRFFDPEGSPKKWNDPLPLPKRRQLAALFLAVERCGVKTVIVDDRRRIDDDQIIQGLVCNAFYAIGVTILEAESGMDLTEPSSCESILAKSPLDQLKVAKRHTALWKGLVKRMQARSKLGRKPFGLHESEVASLVRIRELYQVLPKVQWKKRGASSSKRRSFHELARCLNAENVPSRSGRPWTARTVYGILKRIGLLAN